MSQFATDKLLETESLSIHDVTCAGGCRHQSAAECAAATALVFPYRGVFVRHVGQEDAVAEANQLLFFNADQEYRISHPVEGGDACLSLSIKEPLLEELAPKDQLSRRGPVTFARARRRIDPRAQVL